MSGSVINPSIALNAAGNNALASNNPVAQFGQFANALSAGTQLKGNMLALQGAQALGQAYQSNTDASGNTDFRGVLGQLAQTPAGAYVLPQAIAQDQQRQEEQFKLNQAQLGQTSARTNAYNSALTPLLKLGSNVTPQDVYGTIAGLSSSGFPAGEFAADAAATMPVMDPSQANDPEAQAAYGKQLQGWVYNHAARSWGAQIGVNTALPSYQQQNIGGTIRMVDTNPLTNPSLATGGEDTNTTLTPGEQVDQVTVRDGAGNSYSVPRATLAGLQGQGNLVPPGNGPSNAPSVFGSGRYGSPASQGQAAPQGSQDPFEGGGASAGAGASAPSAGVPSAFGGGAVGMPLGAVRTGVGPATTAALQAQGQEAGAEAASLTGPAQEIPQRKAMLSDMEADLANAPTGPGAQNAAYWSAFANAHLGPLAQSLGIAEPPGQVASFENFEKVAGKFAQAQSQALGAVTNDKLGAAMASNPNTVFSSLGNTGVIHILQGNEDALNARNQAWQGYLQNGGDPSKFQQWSSSFNNSGFDPRVFWMKNMTPAERTSYIGTLTPSQASTFYGNIRTGLANGWVSQSDFAAPSSSASASSAPLANPANGY